MNKDESVALKRINMEGNKMGDINCGLLCKSLIAGQRIVYLNVSKNEISDFGAR